MLKLKCPKHIRYNGKDSPKASCLTCQTIYELRLRALANHVTVVAPHPSEALYDGKGVARD